LNAADVLRNFSYIDLILKGRLHASEGAWEGEGIRTKSDDLDISFYKGDRIDLTELIKEQILLYLPMQPLCSTDCKGLCPKCRKSLKDGPCNCEVKEIDPRFEVLKKLKG